MDVTGKMSRLIRMNELLEYQGILARRGKGRTIGLINLLKNGIIFMRPANTSSATKETCDSTPLIKNLRHHSRTKK